MRALSGVKRNTTLRWSGLWQKLEPVGLDLFENGGAGLPWRPALGPRTESKRVKELTRSIIGRYTGEQPKGKRRNTRDRLLLSFVTTRSLVEPGSMGIRLAFGLKHGTCGSWHSTGTPVLCQAVLKETAWGASLTPISMVMKRVEAGRKCSQCGHPPVRPCVRQNYVP